ncbi:MAG: hypothetical protein DVB23_000293 [Verrucomicrobia bacterium]|nr:MAG: hypothetical protein DVB23_000293 [Verrucomicrobiota bacterium]
MQVKSLMTQDEIVQGLVDPLEFGKRPPVAVRWLLNGSKGNRPMHTSLGKSLENCS